MRRNWPVILFIVCTIIGCKAKEEEQSENEAPAATAYQVVEVKNGGTIVGTVRTTEVSPVPAITIQKDQETCGESHVNSSAPGAGGALQGAIVCLKDIHSGKAFDPSLLKISIDQKICQFLPHIQLARKGAGILVSNSDQELHNANFKLSGNSIMNFAQPPGTPPREVTLDKLGLYAINCDVHGWMRGFVEVEDNPYYAVTDADGKFTLSDVPEGSYTIAVWRDSWKLDEPKDAEGRISGYAWGADLEKEQPVEVKTGQKSEVDFVLP